MVAGRDEELMLKEAEHLTRALLRCEGSVGFLVSLGLRQCGGILVNRCP